MSKVSRFIFSVAALLPFLSLSVHASTPKDLAQKSGCLACHGVSSKSIGPAYIDVAAKYKGNPKAEDILVSKVKAGGSGVWGAIPMPPMNGAVKDEDIRVIVKWVLSVK